MRLTKALLRKFDAHTVSHRMARKFYLEKVAHLIANFSEYYRVISEADDSTLRSEFVRLGLNANETRNFEVALRSTGEAIERLTTVAESSMSRFSENDTQSRREAQEQLKRLKREAQEARRALIEAGDLLPSSEITKRMDISRQALSAKVKNASMFVLEFQDARYYPAFFADDTLDRRLLGQTCKKLAGIDDWEKWLFFTSPKSSLDGDTPLDAIRAGRRAAVLATATGFVER